ncbi:MAG TPA: hypothetical protein VGM83_13690 [Devosiaceae bacterium]|jgi:hypothetical protein
MFVTNDGDRRGLDEVVLFAFDKVALPFQRGLKLELSSFPGSIDARPKSVLLKGEPGDPDAGSTAYYGSVIRVGEELWMWYLGDAGIPGEWYQRLLLARSRDGINWEKPKLGLVEFNGSKANNICALPHDGHIQAAVVMYEPDEPNPARRFKLSYESPKHGKGMCVAFSPDGTSWTLSEKNPVIPYFFEQAGATKIGKAYYINGQGHVGHWAPRGNSRRLVTFISYDFENWLLASANGFQRDALPPRPSIYGGSAGPQVHLGASLWNRGNVIVGVYGMWNGNLESDDRMLVTMNLGLVVTHDALHYVEPIPDFPLISAAEQKTIRPQKHFAALMQGQGFENIGEETLFWYAPWPERESDGIRVARWKRDRLGALRPYSGPQMDAFTVSQPIDLEGRPARLSLNVDGVGEHSQIVASVMTEDLQPIPGFGAEDFVPITASGFDQAARWRGGATIPGGRVRVRIDFKGVRPEDLKLYAAYLRS